MSTLKDIAEKCGVSVSAVCTAINHPHKISPEVRGMILAAAREMNYFVKKVQKIKKVLLAMDNYRNHFFGEYYYDVMFGITQRLSELKLDLRIMSDMNEDYAELYEYNGIVFVGKTPDLFLEKARTYKMPHVIAGHPNPAFPTPTVYQNSAEGVTQLIEYVLSCGHRNIAIITGETNPQDIIWNEFMDTFRSILSKNDLSLGKNMIYTADYSNIQTVEIAFNKILAKRPKVSVIICSNDLIANYVYLSAKKYDVNIPKDISVTGFDGIFYPRFLEKPRPELTTVFADRVEIGRRSVDLLMDLIKDPKKVKNKNYQPMQAMIGRSVKRI